MVATTVFVIGVVGLVLEWMLIGIARRFSYEND